MLASIYDSVKSIIESNSRSSLANTQTVLRVCSIRTFCRACQISKLPTTLAESYLLSQLLLRPATKDEITMIVDQDKNPNLMVNNPATANTPKGTKTIAIVDLTGLAKIGRGEFVTASL